MVFPTILRKGGEEQREGEREKEISYHVARIPDSKIGQVSVIVSCFKQRLFLRECMQMSLVQSRPKQRVQKKKTVHNRDSIVAAPLFSCSPSRTIEKLTLLAANGR